MLRNNLFVVLVIIFLTLLTGFNYNGFSEEQSIRIKNQKERPATYYSAKQAFARLILYLREHKQPQPESVNLASPTDETIYCDGESGGRPIMPRALVSGWDFTYKDKLGKFHDASLNCWGEVTITNTEEEVIKDSNMSTIPLNQFVLDNTDAYRVMLNSGADAQLQYGLAAFFSGILTVKDVNGREKCLIWGSAWCMNNDPRFVVAVDARTGELYRLKGQDTFQPINPQQKTTKKEWNGGYDETSPLARLDIGYSCEPRAYWDSKIANFIYNRDLLQEELHKEKSKASRSASSWMTSGIIQCVLGRWVDAIDDLSRAIQMEPQTDSLRFYRGLILMAVRDLDNAASDFQSLPVGDKDRDRSIEYLSILQGKKSREGTAAFTHNIQTDIGRIPLQVWIGPSPLTIPSTHKKSE